MESIEILIPDNEGNHLVVALSFYDDVAKTTTFQIPDEFEKLDIADISIRKLNIEQPLNKGALYKMCNWLLEQIRIFPNAVFSFICSTETLKNNHSEISPMQYRWNLFECLCKRKSQRLQELGIESKDIVVGPDGYQSYAKVFYRTKDAPIIHLVALHLNNKYN